MKKIFLVFVLGLLASPVLADNLCKKIIKSLESEVQGKKGVEEDGRRAMLSEQEYMTDLRNSYPKDLRNYENDKQKGMAECAKERACDRAATAANYDETIHLYKEQFESEMKQATDRYMGIEHSVSDVHRERVSAEGRLSKTRRNCR
ncbi:MAG: hypothetical protein A3F82_00855 [Deltaproteobacteria bacterium RIFCSPLOWO2_12_FULL_44_12]|nr:MAG: hypothetical protein A2712_04100 [Deltaproteobacteria bacterium RIFCSPHIGHO2_01_FULL_43_49]OGQ16367.1 MAG: hypothetical protein A3D22_02070 [Deltaproteobacteria bacterium RIFCSPHIGHO2_02_FULL_44_53]OGQ27807.1 MAG: hypothetical protein A3D98_08920 [Deltaproteobacteria bacterium RIFCSPHIGHO2_12_FULL_44_21]OGQ32885.1 MAG: hypothetical protein A2979_10000 [Deltaproteobacteria bacterium RIFCSPLOWO2_01_FULL_45_74]OGQ41986.1 MAG: hypothetical protein A3I70_09785 [Deltaproteobacteria bacterium 